jgi:hypothetical protein
MSRPHKPGQGPGASSPSGRGLAYASGDPLVRALAVCIRQAHARRIRARHLD